MNVRLHRQLHHFVVEVVDGGGGVATRSHAEGRVLNNLESFDGGFGGVGGPDWGGIVESGFN